MLSTAPAALAQRGQRQAREPNGAHQLQRQVLLPNAVLVIGKRAGGQLASVVGEPVDATPAGPGGLDEPLEILGVA